MSFKRKNHVTPSNAMTGVILQLQLMSASACIPGAFKTVTLLFNITHFLALAICVRCVKILANQFVTVKQYCLQ